MHNISLLLSTGSDGDELIKAKKQLLSGDKHADKKRKILSDLLLNLEDRSELESRGEDEDWFKGTDFSRYCWYTTKTITKTTYCCVIFATFDQ